MCGVCFIKCKKIKVDWTTLIIGIIIINDLITYSTESCRMKKNGNSLVCKKIVKQCRIECCMNKIVNREFCIIHP